MRKLDNNIIERRWAQSEELQVVWAHSVSVCNTDDRQVQTEKNIY